MADEEEVEETEDEDEEEEDEPPRLPPGKAKKKKRQHHAGGKLYSSEAPVTRSGVAKQDVPMDVTRMRRIGGLDPESARINENSRRVVGRKVAGDTVRWNTDARTKYFDCRRVAPDARISLKQVYPVTDEGIRSTNFSACPTYDDLIEYVKKHHWKGDDAEYQWRAYNDGNSSWAQDKFQLAAEPDHVRGGSTRQEEPAPQQQNSYSPFGSPFQVTGFPFPVQLAGMPQPQQPQAAPVVQPPPGTDPVVAALMQQNAQLMNTILAALGQNAQLQAAVQSMPAMIDQKVREAAPPPAPPAQPAPPSPTPVEQLEQASNLLQTINRAGRVLASQFAPPGQGAPNDPPPPGEDDDFPIQIRSVGPITMAAQDGKIVDNFLLNAALNLDKPMGMVRELLKGLGENREKATELEIKRLEAQRLSDEQKLMNLERAAKLKAQLESKAPPPPEPQPQPTWQAPWADPPAETKPT